MFAAQKSHGDDTPVPVLEPGLGRTWTGRLWVYVRDRPSPQQLRQVAFRALRRQIAEAWYRLWDLSTLFSFFIKAIPSTVRCGAIGGSEPRAAAKVLDAAGRPSFLGGNFEKPAWRCPPGEIDILARHGKVLAVIELKSRGEFASAAAALAPRQRRRIARAAEAFLLRRSDLANLDLRFDLMLVAPLRLPRHWQGAWRTDD